MTLFAVDQQTVAFDTPCRSCGYSLRGLPEVGRCPECGTGVETSLRPGVLCQWEPERVSGTRAALRTVFWGTIAYLALNLATNAVHALWLSSQLQIIAVHHTSRAIETLVVLVLAAAHWRLGERLPASPEPAAWNLYRASTLVVAAANVAVLVLVFGSEPKSLPRQVAAAAGWAGNLAFVLGATAFWSHVRELARRVPSDRLERAAGAVLWVFSGALVVYVAAAGPMVLRLSLGVFTVTRPGWFRWPRELQIATGSGLILIVSGLAGLVVLHRLASQFTSACGRHTSASETSLSGGQSDVPTQR